MRHCPRIGVYVDNLGDGAGRGCAGARQPVLDQSRYVEETDAPFKEGVDVFPKLAASFFAGNNFEACKIGFTAEEIEAQSGENN